MTPQKHNESSTANPQIGHVIDAKHEPYRIYQLIDSDGNLVERTARDVAEGSKLISNMGLWRANFLATLAKVQEWCEKRSKQVRAALVDIRSNKVLFYFVPDSTRYDLELGTEMTALEVDLTSAGIGYVESLQVPALSLERFAGPKSLIVWRRAGDTLFGEPTAT